MGIFDTLLSAGSKFMEEVEERSESERKKAKISMLSKLYSAYDHTDDPERKREIYDKIEEVKNL